jgi:hypothetical protein
MFAAGCAELRHGADSQIVSLAKSPSGRFLAALFRTSVRVFDLHSASLAKLSEYSCPDLPANHWLQWTDDSRLILGTQAGHLVFLSVTSDGFFNNDLPVVFDNPISANSSFCLALVLATPGPLLEFVSPSPDLISSLPIPLPNDIRAMDISGQSAVFVCSDGSAFRTTLHQTDVIEQKVLTLEQLPIQDVAAAQIGRESVALRSTTGVLYRLSDDGIIDVISEVSELFELTADGEFVLSLSSGRSLDIWSSTRCQCSRTRIECIDSDLVASEFDDFGLRLFCATREKLFVIHLAVFDPFFPSFLCHTSTSILDIEQHSEIDVPEQFFPVRLVVMSQMTASVVVASSESCAIMSGGAWATLPIGKSCQALWFQGSFFFALLIGKETDELAVYDAEMALHRTESLEGSFIDVDRSEDRILIATSDFLYLFEIVRESFRRVCVVRLTLNIRECCLTEDDIVVLTKDKELVRFSNEETLVESISHFEVIKDGLFMFFVAHRGQFIRTQEMVVRVGAPAFVTSDLDVCSMPPEYAMGQFRFVKTEFLSRVLLLLLEDPDEAAKVFLNFFRTDGMMLAVAHLFDAACDQGKLQRFCDLLDRFSRVHKLGFLIGALGNVDESHRPVVKDLLPPYETLVAHFPEQRPLLKQAYERD